MIHINMTHIVFNIPNIVNNLSFYDFSLKLLYREEKYQLNSPQLNAIIASRIPIVWKSRASVYTNHLILHARGVIRYKNRYLVHKK